MQALSQVINNMANQSFVQAYLIIELVERAVQTATLYYSQRLPEELARFDWLIDRKDRELTAMEKLWTTLIIPVGQTRAFEKPFITLKEGNYTYLDRFRLESGMVIERKISNGWLASNTSCVLLGEGRSCRLRRAIGPMR